MGNVVEMKSKRKGQKKDEFSSKDTTASLRVSTEIRNQMKAHAVVGNRSLYDLTNFALSEFLKKRGKITL